MKFWMKILPWIIFANFAVASIITVAFLFLADWFLYQPPASSPAPSPAPSRDLSWHPSRPIPIETNLMSIHAPRGFTMPQRKTFPLFVGQKLYTVDGNPIDGMKTNYVEVLATSNGWTRLRYDLGFCITLTDDTVTTCYKPVPHNSGQ